MSPSSTEEDSERRRARGALVEGALCLFALGLAALLLASGSTSIGSEHGPGRASEGAGVGSEAWLAGWVVVFLALSALYTFERRQRAALAAPARRPATGTGTGTGGAERVAVAQSRPIELLLKKKPSALQDRPRPPVMPAPRPNLPEDSTLLRQPSSRAEKEPDEESFSVVDCDDLPPAAAPAPAAAPRPASETPARVADPPPPAPPSQPGRLERCTALRAEGRFEEAARVAREGLAADDAPGPLLIELSRAVLGLGRVNAAIDIARDAHFSCPSRDSISHLIRLLAETRRFTRADGPTLRRAAARHPGQPLLRHAAGVFESMYGEPAAADRELRAALRLEADAELRAAIERDLARVEATRARGDRTQRS